MARRDCKLLCIQAEVSHPVAISVRQRFGQVKLGKLITAAFIAFGDLSDSQRRASLAYAYGLEIHPSLIQASEATGDIAGQIPAAQTADSGQASTQQVTEVAAAAGQAA
jgi:hypothetical protein